jgi:hypothetical protein
MPFCNKCGSSLDGVARFCGRCGAQLQNPTVPFTPTSTAEPIVTPVAGERVLFAIPMWQPRSLGRRDSFAAVITERRLIMAQITKQVMNQAVIDARNQAKAQGNGYWGQVSGQMAAWSSGYADRYRSIDPASILVETPGNFEINNIDLFEVVVRYSAGGDEDPSYYDVTFGSSRGSHQYQMEDRSQFVEALGRSYPSKLKAPYGLPKGVTISF